MVRALDIPEPVRRTPFLASQAFALGLTPAALRGTRFRRLFTGVYACSDLPVTPALRVDAARLLVPDPVSASHHTAAELLALPVPNSPDIHLSVPTEGNRRRVAGLQVHRVQSNISIRWVDGRPTTPPETTFLALAPHLTVVELVVLGDAMVRRGLLSRGQLVAAAAAAIGRNVCRARRAADLVRSRVDSAMETRLRLLLVLSGLPEPRINLPVHDPDGRWLARPDLHYAPERIAMEYDGRHHIERERQWERDLARRERMERHNWRVIVVTAKDFFGAPIGVVQRVADALQVRGHAGIRVRQHPLVTDCWSDCLATSND